VYSALKKSGATAGHWVVIPGAGGGLGHLAVQYAKGFGMRVIGIDHPSKEKLVKDSGAEAFLDFTKYDDAALTKAVQDLTDGLGAHAVIVVNASNKSYGQGLGLLRFRGKMVCVGMPEGDPVPISSAYPAALVLKENSIVGSAVGNRGDAIEALDFAARGLVKVHYEIKKLEDLQDTFKQMEEGKLLGRVVIDLN
jgi:alcohol dehydrogenase, propanol-preferring